MGTVIYSSNNSGGRWWLTDEDWKALEAAGWIVEWCKNPCLMSDDNDKIVEISYPDTFRAPKERWLGALATRAFKTNCNTIAEAVDEWENITKKDSTKMGCSCCGQPHYFELYVDGSLVDGGPKNYDNVSAKFITIRPAPKKRIQGWIVINHGDHGQLRILPAIYGSKELAQKYADSRTSAITYIDTEEGKWDLK